MDAETDAADHEAQRLLRLQTTLGEMISRLPGVGRSIVVFAPPRNAMVLVKLPDGQNRIPPGAIPAIRDLVASSVKGMRPEDVSISIIASQQGVKS